MLEGCAREDCASRSHYVFDREGNIVKYYGNALKDRRTMKTGQRGNLRVPRASLREMLLKGIEKACEERGCKVDDVVKYGKDLVGLERGGGEAGPGSKVVASFADGTRTRPCDLLVAADGVNSRVVSLLGGLYGGPLPAPAPLRLDYFLAIGRSDCSHPLVTGGAYHTMGGEEGRLFLMPYRAGEVMWQLSFPLPAEEGEELRKADILGR